MTVSRSALVFLFAFAVNAQAAVAAPSATPLTPAQAQRLDALAKSLGNVFSVSDGFHKAARLPLISAVSDAAPSPLLGTIQEGECEKKLSLPEDNPPLEAGDTKLMVFTFDIGGPKCPVHYRAELHGQQVGDDKQAFHADFSLSYEAVSTQARQADDVDQTTFNGSIDASVVTASDGLAHIQFKGSFGGQGHSQKEGAFKNEDVFQLAMNVGGAGGLFGLSGQENESLDFGFHDVNAALTSQMGFGANVPTFYKINGHDVPADEYSRYRDELKLPAMNLQNPIGGGPAAPTNASCQIDLYPASGLSLTQAEQAIASHTAINATPLFSMPTGGASQKLTIPINGRDLTIDAQVSTSVIEIHLDLCAHGAACVSVERAFLPDEDRAYADTLGELTSVMACKP